MTARPRIVVVGAGFGGLWAARALQRAEAEVVLIDRTNHHVFQPLLYQVATAGLSAPQIAAPIRHIVERQRNCRVLLAEVTGIDTVQRVVELADGQSQPYDYLVVATGVRHAYFGHDAWAAHAPGLKTLTDALEIRRRVLLAFERAEAESDPKRRAAWLTFVIVGGGPTGVELAGTLAEIARHTLRNEFRSIDPASARVVLLEGGERVLASYVPTLSARAERDLVRLGVEVRTRTVARHIDAEGVEAHDQTLDQTRDQTGAAADSAEHIAACTVLWAAGVQASPLGAELPAERDRAGRVKVAPAGHLPGHPDIWVVGDLAFLAQDGQPLPGVADVAKQMGRHAARCIGQMLHGADPGALPPFRYRDKGALATIGRNSAVAQFPGGIKLSGFIAWLTWVFIHIFFLIDFRNRFVVMLDWAWSYFTYQRHARLIFEREAAPSAPPPPAP
jgi:NADH dehydrogenase